MRGRLFSVFSKEGEGDYMPLTFWVCDDLPSCIMTLAVKRQLRIVEQIENDLVHPVPEFRWNNLCKRHAHIK